MKQTTLLLLTALALQGCSLSVKPSSILKVEVQRAQNNLSYSNGCTDFLMNDIVGLRLDPIKTLSVMMFCSEKGNQFVAASDINGNFNARDSYLTGCLRTAIDKNGPPASDNDANVLLTKCQDGLEQFFQKGKK